MNASEAMGISSLSHRKGARNSTRVTRYFCSSLRPSIPIETSETVYCDSFTCSDGYIPIDHPERKKCKSGECSDSRCCDKVCSSFHCPRRFSPKGDSDNTICRKDKCTKRQCCDKGETLPELPLCGRYDCLPYFWGPIGIMVYGTC